MSKTVIRRLFLSLLASTIAVALIAAGPEDLYLEVYQLIAQGDSLMANQQPGRALEAYQQAYQKLRQLQSLYPTWQPELVQFRLNYLKQKLGPAVEQIGKPKPTETQLQPKDLQEQIQQLQNQLQELQAEKAALQAKLQEALSAQPPARDLGELTRARERIVELEKENAVLRANLEKLQTAQLSVQQAQQRIADLEKQLSIVTKERDDLKNELAQAQRSQTATMELKKVTEENVKLKEQIKQLEYKLSQLNQQSRGQAVDQTKLKAVEQQRDALLKQVALLQRQLQELKEASKNEGQARLLEELNTLRARLAVYEAREVPFTPEELALLEKRAQPSPQPSSSTRVSEQPAGVAALVSDAQLAFRRGDFARAILKFQDALRSAPDNVDLLCGLAAAQIEAGQLEDASKTLERAFQIAPNEPQVLSLKGLVFLRQQKIDEALDLLSKAAQLSPDNPVTQNYLGVALSQKGLRKQAETAFRKAIELDPNYAEAHYNLAVLYAFQDPPFPALARFHYEKAVAGGQPRNQKLELRLSELTREASRQR